MLLTVSTTHRPATDLGYLLVKHPDRVQSFSVTHGTAYVCYPAGGRGPLHGGPARGDRPAGAVRARRVRLGRYVNDRPYAASSLLSVAIAKVFRSALRGESRDRPELAASALPLEIRVPALRCRGGAALAVRMFEPLGWAVSATPIALDETHPEWGDSRYVDLTLTGTVRLADALNQIYVLLPVLDDAKHYWVAPDEVDKLLRAGTGWLAEHPERALIVRRYLAHRRSLERTALEQLTEDVADESVPPRGRLPVRSVPLAEQRRRAVLEALTASGAQRVLDLGCGGGALLADLVRDRRYTEIVGCDVSTRASGDGRAAAASGPAADPPARPDQAVADRSDVPRRPAARLRRRRADGGRRARRPAPAARAGGGGVRPRRSGALWS